MKLEADRVIISGPRIDGNYRVTFEVGEYQKEKIAELLRIPSQTVVTVNISYK